MPEEIDLIVAQGIGETFSCDISLRELPSPELKALCQKFCDDRFKSQVTVSASIKLLKRKLADASYRFVANFEKRIF